MLRITVYLFLLISFSCYSQKARIAVAANAQYALRELVEEYKKKNKGEFELVVGSSGKLTNQIVQGAPFHTFFSADIKYPQELYKKGLTAGQPRVYAYGSLIIWTIKNIKLSSDLTFLKSEGIEKIGIANPKIAPYGAQSIGALTKAGVYRAVKGKIVEGESISQVNQYITSGNCDLGFTAKSVVKSKQSLNKGNWIEVSSSLYDPIPQGVVILKNDDPAINKLMETFITFVFSEAGRAILKRNGYITE